MDELFFRTSLKQIKPWSPILFPLIKRPFVKKWNKTFQIQFCERRIHLKDLTEIIHSNISKSISWKEKGRWWKTIRKGKKKQPPIPRDKRVELVSRVSNKRPLPASLILMLSIKTRKKRVILQNTKHTNPMK